MKVFEENISGFFFHIVDFNGVQRVEGPNILDEFSNMIP